MKQSLFLLILFCSILTSYGIDTIEKDSLLIQPENARQVRSSEDEQSLFNGVIPLSPQAAALARYAEYPVNHTTGIPEITIPLYTIKMGGFELPITISYHASGARINDIPTCVGLGWTLNAGGAITRTILGAPDFFHRDVTSSDYSLHDISTVLNAKKDMKEKGGSENIIRGLIQKHVDFDSESDRYCFNAGGHTGVFRYSHIDKTFYILNKSSYHINQEGCGINSQFTLCCPDNTEYIFSVQENAGVDAQGEGNPYPSAWYVSEINTSWGNVKFTYEQSKDIDVVQWSQTTNIGIILEPDIEDLYPDLTLNKVRRDDVSHVYTYEQQLLKQIEWNGNTITFEYTADNPGKYTDRLSSMEVRNSLGLLVKRVEFNNNDYWMSQESSPLLQIGRRMLTSINDSENGKYQFSYNRNIRLPNHNNIDASKYSDLWGFYRGTKNLYNLPKEVADKMLSEAIKTTTYLKCESVDRSPVLEATQAGVLSKIIFPTGGNIEFQYELNSCDERTIGGLRVAKKTISTGDKVNTIKYVYSSGIFTQEQPEDLMCFNTYRVVYHVPIPGTYQDYLLQYFRTTIKTSNGDPIRSPFQPGNHVSYTTVEEIMSDGSKSVYYYDSEEASYIGEASYYERIDTLGMHPSLFKGAIIDQGNRLPLLIKKVDYDKNGKQVRHETRTYAKTITKEFSTGVRVVGTLVQYSYINYSFSDLNHFIAWDGHFQCAETTARIRAANLKSVTTTDLTTGYTETKEYTYDTQLRTMSPRSESITNSDGKVHLTVYEYPFDRTDPVSLDLMKNFLPDFPMSEKKYSGSTLLSTKEFGYAKFYDRYYPTSISTSLGSGPLYERERINSYNKLGSPLTMISEASDSTILSWDTRGNLLLSSTQPGGLTTRYTHVPLCGLESLTQPNGHKTTFAYNSAGMLVSESDHLGTICRYSYSIKNHTDATMNTAGNSITTELLLDDTGLQKKLSRQYHDAVGRPYIFAEGGLNTSGTYIYSGTKYDELDREIENWLPVVGSTQLSELTISSFSSLASQTYGDDKAFSKNTYDGTGRVIDTTTPGKEWYDAGKSKKTAYITNRVNEVKLYTAPMDEISLVKNGYYPSKTLQGTISTDEDGKTVTVFTDRLGRKVLERRGTSTDTYFVYNDLGQLRYVLSPEYQDAGYKDKYVYEYRYDDFGNLVKKFTPGCGYIQYWYDRAGRQIFMQDETLRARKLHRFYLYDKAGRQCIQGVCSSSNRGSTVNPVSFTGNVSGGFQSTGYVSAKPTQLEGILLESVTYYDTYGFVSITDSRLRSTGADAKGLVTGSVVYNTDGSCVMSSLYYDLRGNVTESREIQEEKLRTTRNTYNFTDNLLTTTVSEEDGLTYKLSNGYHTGSGLLLTTDLTVNSVTQRIASRKYDSLGRISQFTRGPDGKSGSIDYTYILNGQLKSISGPAFSQVLYYTDGQGTPCYNGSISSYVWTMGTSARKRGYMFDYDKLNRLILAKYGENDDLATDPNRYTEKVLEYSTNSMIRRFQRHGLKANGITGKIDNLHITLDGNRISEILEDADPVTTPGSMDFAGATGIRCGMTYDAAGNLASDAGRSIVSIRYDNSNRPLRTVYGSGSTTDYLYSADGVKLRTINTTAVEGVMTVATDGAEPLADPIIVSRDTTDYRGKVIYRNGHPDMLLFEGGYVTFNGDITFHYYTRDYLGNNRAVINGTTGAIEQTVAYYPFGGVIADLGTNLNLQPYKFTGKELDQTHGLNEYDLESRRYYPSVPTFTQPDPKAEYCNWVSPYAYCLSNPVNNFDPDGEFAETLWDIGNVLYDAGAAIYHHVIDDHETAKSYWKDAAFDMAAAIIPGVPAGTSKLAKAASNTAKAVDKASDTAKATKASKALNTQKTASTSTGSIKYQRQKAVKEAWKDERNLVEAGQGTRKWSAAEIEELLLTGKVKGYEGHHINSVKDFPHLAGNPDNVTFMTRKEHLLEHFGNWRNKTEGPLLNRKIK